MPIHRARTAGFLLITLLLGATASLRAQMAAPAASWHADAPVVAPISASPPAPLFAAPETSATHGHTLTGLLIGGTVGVAAAGLFLAGFCNDGDSPCGTYEYSRAAMFIALPPAVVGALIGTLVRTKD